MKTDIILGQIGSIGRDEIVQVLKESKNGKAL